MRIGVMLPFGASDGPGRLPTWREMHAFATHAEAIGLDSLWVCDHFLSGPAGRPAEAIHEGWTIVAALAASTSTIELGQLVMCVSFRSPALLAKMAVTADGVSGGRLVLGLGVGRGLTRSVALGRCGSGIGLRRSTTSRWGTGKVEENACRAADRAWEQPQVSMFGVPVQRARSGKSGDR